MRGSTVSRVVLGLVIVSGANIYSVSEVSAETRLAPERRNLERQRPRRDLPRVDSKGSKGSKDSRGTRESRLAQARERRAAARQNLANALRNSAPASNTEARSVRVNSETSRPDGATQVNLSSSTTTRSERRAGVGAGLVAQRAEQAAAGRPSLGSERRNVPQPRPSAVERRDLPRAGRQDGPRINNLENRPQRGLVQDRTVTLSMPGQ